jgi:hypothetical protein
MGILFVDARNLLEARRGESGGSVVTFGRQTAYFHKRDLAKLAAMVGDDPAATKWLANYHWRDPADGFLREVLRFENVDSIDFSDYEGASIVHDIGEPIPVELHGRYDLAIDGGTLEHVFNLPVALANLIRLVRVGGHAYTHGPANNLCGHGLYQFSPELMHRVFSRENGFELSFVRVAKNRHLSTEASSGQPVFDVADPKSVGGRILIRTSHPVTMMTMARRIEDCEPFKEKVLQSDYVAQWGSGPGSRRFSLLQRLKTRLNENAPGIVAAALDRRASLGYRHHFRRVW